MAGQRKIRKVLEASVPATDLPRNCTYSITPAIGADQQRAVSKSSSPNSSLHANSKDEQLKMYRIYFNSKADAPRCWSVDEGTVESEIIVASIQLIETNLLSRLNLLADNVRDPKAWFEVRGRLSMHGNDAVIKGR